MPIRVTRAIARRLNARPLWRGAAITTVCVAAGVVAVWYVAVVPYQPSSQTPGTWPGAERVSRAETLQLAYSYRQAGDLAMVERLCWQVLLESSRVEELAAARDLVQQVRLGRPPASVAPPLPSQMVSPPSERVIAAPPPGAPLVVATPRPVAYPALPPAPGHRGAPTPTVPMSDTVSASQWLEQWVPSMVQAVANQVALQMVMTGDRRITRFYTAEEIQRRWLPELIRRLPATVTQATIEIHPEGVASLCRVEWLGVAVPLTSVVQVRIESGRPHVAISRLAIDQAEVPDDLLRRAEHRVNQIIDQQRLPVRLKSFELREGAAVLSAELV